MKKTSYIILFVIIMFLVGNPELYAYECNCHASEANGHHQSSEGGHKPECGICHIIALENSSGCLCSRLTSCEAAKQKTPALMPVRSALLDSENSMMQWRMTSGNDCNAPEMNWPKKPSRYFFSYQKRLHVSRIYLTCEAFLC